MAIVPSLQIFQYRAYLQYWLMRVSLSAARQIVDITKRHYEGEEAGLLPREIASKEAFENAITVVIAVGGSTKNRNGKVAVLTMEQEGGCVCEIFLTSSQE